MGVLTTILEDYSAKLCIIIVWASSVKSFHFLLQRYSSQLQYLQPQVSFAIGGRCPSTFADSLRLPEHHLIHGWYIHCDDLLLSVAANYKSCPCPHGQLWQPQ